MSQDRVVVECAEMVERSRCIACASARLSTLDRGRFADDPHLTMLRDGIWGTSPLPYLEQCEWELVACDDCDQVFHKYILTPEWDERRHTEWMTKDAMERFEEQHGAHTPEAGFDRGRSGADRILCLEKMTRGLRSRGEAMRLLDFGCGWGHLVTMGNLFGFEAHGVDRSSARRTGQQGGLGTVFPGLEDYVAECPQPVHAVTMLEVLEHLAAPADILRSLHQIMAPGGILLLEVPDASGVRRIATERDLITDGIDHLNSFTPITLTGIARQTGFEPIRPETAHVTADFARVVKREARRLVRRFRPRRTQQYFRRDRAETMHEQNRERSGFDG